MGGPKVTVKFLFPEKTGKSIVFAFFEDIYIGRNTKNAKKGPRT